jgi:hypothetical protein
MRSSLSSKMFSKSLMTLACISTLAGLTSCNEGSGSSGGGAGTIIIVGGGGGGGSGGNSGGGGGTGGGTVDINVNAWFDVFGNGCATATSGPRPGCNYYWYSGQLVKIMDVEDPYFDAYYYNLVYDYYTYSLNGVVYEFTGWAWISQTGIIYDEYGNALNQRQGRGRDIVGDVANVEIDFITEAGKEFAARYSLSEEKGIQVAHSLNEWAKLGKERAKTDADLAEFSTKLYGIDYVKVKAALEEAIKGNESAMKETVAEAAKSWGTSEENMKGVLKAWYGSVPGL